MNKPPPPRSSRKPVAHFDGKVFHVEWRGRNMQVQAALGAQDEVLVELDGVTHWAPAQGEAEPREIAIEELGDILDAIESAAEDAGLSIFFE